jgi:hypothetical protein
MYEVISEVPNSTIDKGNRVAHVTIIHLMNRLQKLQPEGIFSVAISKSFFKPLSLLVFSSALFISPVAFCGTVPKGDLFFGYSRTGTDTFYPNVGALNGWDAAAHLKLHMPFLGIEGDVAHYGLGANSSIPRTTTYLFGPRATVGLLGTKVFAHALVGGKHSANSGGPTPISSNGYAYMLGGGLDFPIFPFFAWRIAGDYTGVPAAGGTPARFSTGIVFRF